MHPLGQEITPAYVEAACEVMHDAYERAAVGAGWETNAASRKPWADVPEANKETMRAAVFALLAWQERESTPEHVVTISTDLTEEQLVAEVRKAGYFVLGKAK